MTAGWDADVGGWMMRVLMIMMENRVERVCRDCMDLHWEYVDERMRTLEVILPRFLGALRRVESMDSRVVFMDTYVYA